MSLRVLWPLLTQAKLPEQSGQLSGVSLIYPITVEALGLMVRDSLQCLVHWVCSLLVVLCKAYPRASGYDLEIASAHTYIHTLPGMCNATYQPSGV